MDYSPPGSSAHGILQARMLEWVAISFSRESSRPRDRTQVSHITEWVSEVAQSCSSLWDPMHCSLPGFSIHGISQARILKWVANSCAQMPLALKTDYLVSPCPRAREPDLRLRTFLWENFSDIIIFQFVGHPFSQYEIWFYHSLAPRAISLCLLHLWM